jgi:xanthine/CO dehydrogenase XdhC/CoxF family maturation factor
MTERSIIDAAARLRRTGEPYLVATVVNVCESAYRQPGARMLLTRFRWTTGSASGGCLEGDLSREAWSCTRDGHPALLTYNAPSATPGEDDDDVRSAFGLGCDGAVEVLVERTGVTGRIDALELADRSMRAQRRGAVATVFRATGPSVRIGARMGLVAGGELEDEATPLEHELRELIGDDMRAAIEAGASTNRHYELADGKVSVFIEVMLPPPRLFVFGTGHDAVPVAQLARSLGWDVVVCADDQRHAIRDRFTMADEILVGTPDEIAPRIRGSERALAVVMNHDVERDADCLAMLVETDVCCIGMLGPHAMGDPRIEAPPVGAHTPQELAMAIVSDMLVALRRAPHVRVEPPIVVRERFRPTEPLAAVAAV